MVQNSRYKKFQILNLNSDPLCYNTFVSIIIFYFFYWYSSSDFVEPNRRLPSLLYLEKFLLCSHTKLWKQVTPQPAHLPRQSQSSLTLGYIKDDVALPHMLNFKTSNNMKFPSIFLEGGWSSLHSFSHLQKVTMKYLNFSNLIFQLLQLSLLALWKEATHGRAIHRANIKLLLLSFVTNYKRSTGNPFLNMNETHQGYNFL